MNCCYSSFGCKFQGQQENIKQHETDCPYRFIEENERLKQQIKEPTGQVDFKTCLLDKYPAVSERLKKAAANITKIITFLKNQQYQLEQYGKHLSSSTFPVENLG